MLLGSELQLPSRDVHDVVREPASLGWMAHRLCHTSLTYCPSLSIHPPSSPSSPPPSPPLPCLGSFRARRRAKDTFKDTHVTLCPYFTVPAGKMEEFKANYVSFYEVSPRLSLMLSHVSTSFVFCVLCAFPRSCVFTPLPPSLH
jgi:hypothetical protein